MIVPLKDKMLIGIAGLTLLGTGYRTYGQERSRQQQQQPNIIFILTDDQRWDALGIAGNKIIKTPEMDKLAAAGVYFTNSLVTTPICSASRASILTGVYERTHRYTFQTGPINDELMDKSYPMLVKAAGYHTGFFGKLGVNYPAKDMLFDVIDDYDRNNQFKDYRGYYYKTIDGDTVHLTRYTGQQALDFIDNVPQDKPFCLSLSFSAPHAHDGAPEQYFWQKETAGLFENDNIPGPRLADDSYFQALPQTVREGFNRVRWGWRYNTDEKYIHSVKGYYRMIYEIDQEIGKIRSKLKENKLDKNTVIIIMGDNGYFMGERQLAGKWLMYDNSLRVPLIVYDPRVNESRRIDDMVLNIDVPATIADLAGVKPPETWHGRSLMPLILRQPDTPYRDTVLIEHLWEFENIPPSEGIRTSQWKYFRYVNDRSAEELYDLKNDPDETKNLAKKPKYSAILIDLRLKCNNLSKAYSDPEFTVPTALTVKINCDSLNVERVDLRPEFGWELPKGAVSQKGYQLLLATQQESINNNTADVWNSGRVASPQFGGVEPDGIQLQPNTIYFWKVRIYDQDNRLSDYSAPQMFQTGGKRIPDLQDQIKWNSGNK